MSKFLAQLDDLNYPSKIARTLADGEDATLWIELTVPTQFDSDFALHFDKYLVNPDTKVITPRPDAPTGVTADQLLAQYNDMASEVKQVKQASTAQTMAVAKLSTDGQNSDDKVTAQLTQLQQSMTQVMMAVAQQSATPAPTSTNATTTDTATTEGDK